MEQLLRVGLKLLPGKYRKALLDKRLKMDFERSRKVRHGDGDDGWFLDRTGAKRETWGRGGRRGGFVEEESVQF